MKFYFGFLLAVGFLVAGCHSPQVVKMAPPNDGPALGTSPGAKFTMLPQAVQDTVTAQGGAAEIKDINKVVGPDRDIYEIRFSNPGMNPNIYVAEDGTLINTTVPGGGGLVSKLPAAVQKVIQEQMAGQTITDVRASQHFIYEITFKDPGLHPKLLITETGDVLVPK